MYEKITKHEKNVRKNNVQVLVTEYLAGGDLVTRTAPEDYNLTERKCQIFIRQVSRQSCLLSICSTGSTDSTGRLSLEGIYMCFLFL